MSLTTKRWLASDCAGNGLTKATRADGLTVKPDSTSADVNKAKAIGVDGNGVYVKVDGTSIKENGSGQLQAVGAKETVEMHLITAGETVAGFFTLAAAPATKSAVRADVVGGPMQVNKQSVGASGATPDFDILGASFDQFHFKNVVAVGLSQDLDTGDVVIVRYEV